MSNPEILPFRADSYTVFQAAEKSIFDLGLKVDSADPDNELIQFRSPRGWRTLGGEELSLLLIEESRDAVLVRISTRVNAHLEMLQVADWDAGRTIARMVHQRMGQYIDENSPTKLMVPVEKINACRVCHVFIKPDTEFCETCGLARGGTGGKQTPKPKKELEETEDDFFAALGMDQIAKSKKPAVKRPAVKKSAPQPVEQSQLILECDCGARLRIEKRLKGQKVRCPRCKESFLIDS